MAPEGKPAQIGRYEVRREIGRGTMGVVYEAHDPSLGRTVALKTISLAFADHEGFERRFQSEARIAAGLSHPGIVVVHDVGRDPSGVVFMALEYLVGRTLDDVLATDGRLEWREALRIVARVAEALHHAHGQGVVHRDIKPANIMLLASGEPKIMDFGVAKRDDSQLTSPGQLFGTPLYMAPEQALGQPTDGRADLFSLGSVLYALITGRPPFEGDVATVIAQVAHRRPKPPSEIVPGLPADLDYVVSRLTAKSPSDRYPDGKALADDLEDVLRGRPPRHRVSWTPQPTGQGTLVANRDGAAPPLLDLPLATRRRRRRPSLVLLLLLAAAGAGYFYLRSEDRRFWHGQWETAREREPVRTAMARLRSLAGIAPAVSAPGTLTPPSATIGREASTPRPAPSVVAAEADPPVSATPATDPEDAPPSPPAATAAEPGPLPSPAATESATTDSDPASPAPAASPQGGDPPPRAAEPPGRLAVTFEHHLKSGTVELWVDGRSVLKEPLDRRVERKTLFFEIRKGRVQQVLSLPPGRHEVRVEVLSEKKRSSSRTTASFRSGGTRQLEARMGRPGGNVELRWK